MIQIKTNQKRLIYFLIIGSSLAISGLHHEGSFIEYLEIQFDKYNKDNKVERTYLMTDRFVYRPGEDLWFKGYVISGNPGINSEDFFVRLISDRGDEIIYRRYPISFSETSGRLVIPRSCIPGKYWLIAYTGWMKNRCPQEAFRKEILISKYFERRFQVEAVFNKKVYKPGDTLMANIRIVDPAGRPISDTPFDYVLETFRKTDIKGSGDTDIKGKSKISFIVPELDELLMLTVEIRNRRFSGDHSLIIPTISVKHNMMFFPEGGDVIAGLPSLMAFTATDQYGIPQVISGVLSDGKGNVIDTVFTGSNGKGIFEFMPGNDSLYLAIPGLNGRSEVYPLPFAKPQGSIIRFLGRDGDTARFLIKTTQPQIQKSFWVAVLNNRMVWSSTENYKGEKFVNIPVNGMPGGIMQITVFDEKYNILAERLIRIRNNEIELHVQMERQQYRNRQRVSLLIESPERINEGNLAVSVSLDNLAHHVDDPMFQDIFISGVCSSEFGRLSILKSDIDLITSRFYPVSWKDILAYADIQTSYINKDGLNGMVYDKKENIAPHAKVRITHFPNFRLYETQTDEEGSFRILFGSDIIDYKFLNIDAYDALGKTSLSPRIDYSYIEELQKDIVKNEDSEKDRAFNLKKYGEPDLVYDLRYGPGKFRKSRTDTRKKYDPYQYADYTDIMDIIQDIQPYRLVDNKIIFLDRNRQDSTINNEAIIVINGALKGTNTGALKNIIPSDITNINISDASLDIRKYTPLKFNSVIEITTIQGMSRYSQSNVQTGQGILNSDKEFYSPDYAVESSYSADNRKTLYWNPKISLYQGNSIVVTFYTSDVKGTFYGLITGVDNEGNPLEKTFSFRVE